MRHDKPAIFKMMMNGQRSKPQRGAKLPCGTPRCRGITVSVVIMALFLFGQQLSFAQTAPAPALTARAATDGRVWGALVYAHNDKLEKTEDTPDLPNLAHRLGQVFPFKSFEILGQHGQVIFREYESWVVPSKDLFLKLDSKGAAKGGGINLHVQFWQGQQVLVKLDTVLHPDSPLFIAGPKWRQGRLVFVLVLKKPDAGHPPK